MNKAVFLDRDGVINYDYGFVHKISDFKFIPKVLNSGNEDSGIVG